MAEQDGALAGDSDAIRTILADQERLAGERAPYEGLWREIDQVVDPFGSGAWSKTTGVNRDVERLFDTTAIDGLDRFTAAIAGVTIPRNQRWHGLRFADAELMKLEPVRLWCEVATDRLFEARYAPTAGFEIQAHEDIRQEGKYGTAPLWVDQARGRGMFYKSLHLSEVFIDENYYGRVDKVHRAFELTLRQAIDQFGLENLSDKLQAKARDPRTHGERFEFLHIVRPNGAHTPGQLGPAGKPIESVYLEVDQKHLIQRGGYYSMPIPVSRHITGPRDKYGRSPAMKVLATAKGLQAMARIILDAGNRAVDPPLLMTEDITRIVTKPGGANPGGLDEMGRPMIQALQTGGSVPIGLELQAAERAVVKQSFLEEFFRLLSDPSDRMTATQVMETLQKEGVLIAPFAGRRETEKMAPIVNRELDIQLRAGWIPPLPDEVKEAGAWPMLNMTNPLARMARAEEVSGFTRLTEIAVQVAGAGHQEVLDVINFDQGIRDAADVLGVRPSHINSPEALAAKRAERDQAAAEQQAAQVAPQVAGAALDLAKTNEIAAQLANGGGM
jgi:hypothetical protein